MNKVTTRILSFFLFFTIFKLCAYSFFINFFSHSCQRILIKKASNSLSFNIYFDFAIRFLGDNQNCCNVYAQKFNIFNILLKEFVCLCLSLSVRIPCFKN